MVGSDTLPIIILENNNNNNDDDISLMNSAQPWSKTRKRTNGTNIENAISVEKYHRSSIKRRALINLDYYYDDNDNDDDVQVVDPSALPKKPETVFTCEICADEKAGSESFRIPGCKHTYCSQCVVSYISSRLDDNIVRIGCPVSGCLGVLEPYGRCRTIMPAQVLDRWGVALCESSIVESHKFYCPFKDCSVLLLTDDHSTPPTGASASSGQIPVPQQGAALITESECPYCRRMFCAQCKAPWHHGISCVEFQKLGKDEREREDIMLMNLANKSKWRRCKKCNFYVEKTSGCLFIQCRCGNTFCYNCGTSPMINHFCSICKR